MRYASSRDGEREFEHAGCRWWKTRLKTSLMSRGSCAQPDGMDQPGRVALVSLRRKDLSRLSVSRPNNTKRAAKAQSISRKQCRGRKIAGSSNQCKTPIQ